MRSVAKSVEPLKSLETFFYEFFMTWDFSVENDFENVVKTVLKKS